MNETILPMMKSKEKIIASDSVREMSSQQIKFSELYRRNVSPVYYYLYSRVGNPHDAEDLTSQTFVTALETLQQLRDPAKFTSWVFSIARNKATDHFRKAKRRPTADLEDELQADTGLSQNEREDLIELERLVSRLNPLEQDYLRLRLVANLPFAEIASILSKPETQIKKQYYRLLERLKAQVEQ